MNDDEYLKISATGNGLWKYIKPKIASIATDGKLTVQQRLKEIIGTVGQLHVDYETQDKEFKNGVKYYQKVASEQAEAHAKVIDEGLKNDGYYKETDHQGREIYYFRKGMTPTFLLPTNWGTFA